MTDQSRADLPWGHFGQAEYLLDDNEWHFSRDQRPNDTFHLLGELTTIIETSNPIGDSEQPEKASNVQRPSRRHAKQAKAIIKVRPELQSASNFLPLFLRTSEAVQDAVQQHEPIRGALVAFSRIYSSARHDSLPVAVMPSGEDFSSLRIIHAPMQRRGWGEDKVPFLEVPTLGSEDTEIPLNRGPIQQILFSDKSMRENLLAVRLLTRTLIFRPTHGVASSGSGFGLDLLYSVNIEDTGMDSHADVAFNPWFSQQVGSVDFAGNWTITELESARVGRVAKSWRGKAERLLANEVPVFDDGWARLTWIRNLQTVLVCTRRNFTLFSIATDEPTFLKKIALPHSGTVPHVGEDPWALDLRLLPQSSDCLCLLTTMHLLLYEVSGDRPDNMTCVIRMKIRHFRNPDDLSMRLTTWSEDEIAGLLIYSGITNRVSSYLLRLTESGPTVLEDYTDFEIKLGNTGTGKTSRMAGLQIIPVQMVEQLPGAEAPSHEDDISAPNPYFYAITVLEVGSAVHQGLFYRVRGSDLQHHQPMPIPSWSGRLEARTANLPHEDSLVDAAASSESEDDPINLQEPIARRMRRLPLRPVPGASTTNLELVAACLQGPDPYTQDLEELSTNVEAELARKDPDRIPAIRTLRSLSHHEVTFGDAHEASRALDFERERIEAARSNQADEPLEAVDPGFNVDIVPVSISSVPDLQSQVSEKDVSDVFDSLVAEWITTLSSQIPGRIRLAKLELARRTAADLFLASRALRLEERVEQPATQETQETYLSAHTWELPARYSEPPTPRSSSQPPEPVHISQRPALPTPSLTGTPSIITTSSHASSYAAPQIYRLSRYTSFNNPTPLILPRAMIKILNHWHLGEDPNSYEWVSVTQRVTQQEDEEPDEEVTEKERRRALRQQERKRIRDRKEAKELAAQRQASSQATEIFSASQPSGARFNSQTARSQSQGFPSSAMAASQTVPGRFGGRPPPRKKRKQGF